MEIKPVLILESNNNTVCLNEEASIIKTNNNRIILSGVFTEFDVENRNKRIYTAAKFLPHLNEMNERIQTLGAVYGEFDHPDNFDISLSRMSHLIESATYVQEKNRVEGSIRLLNNHYGREAQALILDQCPLFVSSRAAGVTESNGTVAIKRLFTYDLVADPGFASARMNIKNINENLAYNESANFLVFDITDESKINQLFEMNANDNVTKQQLVEYTDFIKTEISQIKSEINSNVKEGKDPEKFIELTAYYEKLMDNYDKMQVYLDYLAKTVQVVVNENIKLKAKTEKLIIHNDYLAEHLEKSINYTKYVAEKLDHNISFNEYLAEHINRNIAFSNYLAENVDKSIAFIEYVAENVDKNIDYSMYLAEHVDKNIAFAEYIAEHVDKNIEYSMYLAEHVDNNIIYTEYVAENASHNEAYTKYIAESLDKTIDGIKSIKSINEGIETPDQSINYKVTNVAKYYNDDDDMPSEFDDLDGDAVQPIQIQTNDEPAQLPAQTEPVQTEPTQTEPVQAEPTQTEPVQAQESETILIPGTNVDFKSASGDHTGSVISFNNADGYAIIKVVNNGIESELKVHESKLTIKSNSLFENEIKINDKISQLIAETKKQKVLEQNRPHFLMFLSESNQELWNGLSLEDKERINVAISERTYTSEKEVLNIIRETLDNVTKPKTTEEILIANIPDEYVDTWNSLNDTVKKNVLAQAKFYQNLTKNESAMSAFWNSRNLENYLIDNSKKLISENVKYVDDSKLSDQQLNSYLAKFEQLK